MLMLMRMIFFFAFYGRCWSGDEREVGKVLAEITDKPLFVQVLWCGQQRCNVWLGFQDRHYGLFVEIVRAPGETRMNEGKVGEKILYFRLDSVHRERLPSRMSAPAFDIIIHTRLRLQLCSLGTCRKCLCERKQMLFRLCDMDGV